MYQFTTTNVINTLKATDYEGSPLLDHDGIQVPKFVGSATGLWVAKVGNFKKANIVSVFKRPYTDPEKEVATITVPSVPAEGLIVRLDLVIKLDQSTQSEYANYTLDFQKPITVEVLSPANPDVNKIAKLLAAQLNGLKDRFGHSYVTAAAHASTGVITITCKQPEQRIKSAALSSCNMSDWTTGNSIIQPVYVSLNPSLAITTPGAIGFGDNNWMMRQVMLPTAENVRVFGISKDERPILGGNYSQYTLHYTVAKDGVEGIVAGGNSVTTHVFWVISTQVTNFEAALIAAGIVVDTVGVELTSLAVDDSTLTLTTNAGTEQLTYTSDPADVIGGVWSLNPATNDVAGTYTASKVTLTNSGLLTVVSGSGLDAADKLGVNVTVDGVTATGLVTIA